MSEAIEQVTVPTLPFAQEGLFQVPPELVRLRAAGPITRVRTATGDSAWLVTRHADAKALLVDDRLDTTHPEPERAARIIDSPIIGGPRGTDREQQKREHAQLRALLAPAFSAKRMRAQRDHIADLTDQLLTEIESAGPPADLHETLSYPLPALVISSLLGVPAADRADFRRWSEQLGTTGDPDVARSGFDSLRGYMTELLARKRVEPGEDVLTDLTRAQAAAPEFRDEYAVSLAAGLLFAGHETTAVRIDLGVVLLLTNPTQREAMMADPALVPSAVEEVLRTAHPQGLAGLPRYAQVDFTFGGELIRTGDAVLFGGGNSDPAVYDGPDRFDVRRRPNPHLTFSHGAHFCVGAQLARVELAVVLEALFRRFPNLALAVPVEDLAIRRDQLGGGLTSLPVSW